jgi:hypothetical protein
MKLQKINKSFNEIKNNQKSKNIIKKKIFNVSNLYEIHFLMQVVCQFKKHFFIENLFSFPMIHWFCFFLYVWVYVYV